MNIKTSIKTLAVGAAMLNGHAMYALDHQGITSSTAGKGYFPLISAGSPTPILADSGDLKGVVIAVNNQTIEIGKV